MKWIIVLMFYYSCYNPDELEIIYEGANHYTVYSYDNHECGSDVYSNDVDQDYESDDSGQDEKVVPQWTPPFLRFW